LHQGSRCSTSVPRLGSFGRAILRIIAPDSGKSCGDMPRIERGRVPLEGAATRTPLGWNAVRFFLAEAQEGTVAKAAHSLGVDQTTVSRRIHSLEKSLRVALFARDAPGLAVTSAGERVLFASSIVCPVHSWAAHGHWRRWICANAALARIDGSPAFAHHHPPPPCPGLDKWSQRGPKHFREVSCPYSSVADQLITEPPTFNPRT
jgi:hypothetical protein